MAALTGFLKPCYLYAPGTLLRRIAMAFRPEPSAHRNVRLPWGAVIEVNPAEVIGRELVRQNIFDIAVSETAWRLLRAGDTAVDVGANIGYMSSLFAYRVGTLGHVEAFEPHPRIFARLQRNLGGLNSSPGFRVRLHHCALGDRDGSARLLEPKTFGINEGTAALALEHGAATDGFDVRIAQFDTLMGDREVALLKVDVEGLEPQVFAGAAHALARRRIRHIIYEAHDCERSAVHALLAGYGYEIFGIGHGLGGLRLTAGTASPRVDRRWESPSYLASCAPGTAVVALKPRGWQVLRSC
jgi:FkbM family methyltransferase